MIKEFRQLLAWSARFTTPQHALLLPIQSVASARHLLPLARLANEMCIDACYTLSHRVGSGESGPSIRTDFNTCAREVDSVQAHHHRWTLVVVADHGHFRTLLPTGSPVIHIGHGSPSKTGPRDPHLPWEYGMAPRRRNGEVAYREMIEASDEVRAELVRMEPSLADRIRVFGRLLDDEMLKAATDRAQTLQTLQLDPDKPILMIASTIRSSSLFGRYWDVMLPQLRSLADRYQIVLCPHPNEHAMWKARLGEESGMLMLGPEQSAENVLAVAQALVVDFSSLSHKATLLDVPMVLSHCDPLPVWSEGATARLYKVWPQWDGSVALETRLREAEAMRGSPATQAVKKWVNSRPGQAHRHFAGLLAEYFPATQNIGT